MGGTEKMSSSWHLEEIKSRKDGPLLNVFSAMALTINVLHTACAVCPKKNCQKYTHIHLFNEFLYPAKVRGKIDTHFAATHFTLFHHF